MKQIWMLFLLLAFASPGLMAQEKEEAKEAAKEQVEEQVEEEKTIAQKFNESKAAYLKSMRKFRSQLRRAKRDEREAITEERDQTIATYSEEMMALAGMAEEEKAIDILMWVLTNGNDESAASASATIFTDHIQSKKIGGLINTLSQAAPSPTNEMQLRKLIDENPHDEIKARASLGLATYLTSFKRLADMPDGWTNEKIDTEVESLLQSVVDNYSDVSAGRGGTFGEMADGQLFAMKSLVIGAVAEDIIGTDLDGEEFKLSDYRGKVVVLDFWGDW